MPTGHEQLEALLERSREEVAALAVGLERRQVIGQAQGMLMERYGLDAGQAASFLDWMSNYRSVDTHSVAAEVVRTRRVPGTCL